MRIALIKPPATYANWYRKPLLGIGYLSAVIRQNGFEEQIFDAYFNGWDQDELIKRVIAYNPDLVGITAMTHEINAAAEIASKIKLKSDVRVVIGGPHITALSLQTMEQFSVFDYGIFGEGEKPIIALLNYLDGKNEIDIHDIGGLVFREEGSIVINKPGELLNQEELDKLPYPAFHHYYGTDRQALSHKGEKYVMMSSRGCPYGCYFCMQVLGRKVRTRSAENIVAEIEYAISAYGAKAIGFQDDVILFNNSRTYDLLNLLIKTGLSKKIRWAGLVRADLVNEDIIRLAKLSGCTHLEIGIESGDDEILKRIHKRINTAQITKAVDIIKKSGISIKAYFILGHPYETKESIKRTHDLAVGLNTDSIAVGLMVPYPGTKIFEMACQGEGGYHLLSQQWDDYDKYMSKVLDLEGLPHSYLASAQKKMLLDLYLKNRRYGDLVNYLWHIRKAIAFGLRKKIGL